MRGRCVAIGYCYRSHVWREEDALALSSRGSGIGKDAPPTYLHTVACAFGLAGHLPALNRVRG